ncbi:MAG: hypothetical protein KGH55_01820 [Nanoarchaeota archaeon]|nr:hypothetical protein [Nanoarchaeota archaeon]
MVVKRESNKSEFKSKILIIIGIFIVLLALVFLTFFIYHSRATGYVISNPTTNGNTSLNYYTLVNNTLLQLSGVYIDPSLYTNDYVMYTNPITGSTYTRFGTSSGHTYLVLNGTVYNVSYGGPTGASVNSWAQIVGSTVGNISVMDSLYSNTSLNGYILSTNLSLLLQLTNVWVDSTSYTNDYVMYQNVLTGLTYKTGTPSSSGHTYLVLNGTVYNVSYGGPTGASVNSWAQIVGILNSSISSNNPTNTTTPTYSCSKSNGGNIYVKGLIQTATFSGWDSCSNNVTLAEYYCTNNSYIWSIQTYSCPYGCSDGACISSSSNNNLPLNQSNTVSASGNTSENLTNQTVPASSNANSLANYSGNQTITSPLIANNTLICPSGCLYKAKCLPYGYRIGTNYCNINNTLTMQINSGICDNNFECASNLCANSECVTPNFLQQIINFFRNMFGI